MNSFSIIILGALVFEFSLSVITNLLNVRALKLKPPPTLEEVYKPDEYRNSQEYTRVTTRFGFLISTFRLSLLLCFWFAGGFNYVGDAVAAWGYGPILSGLLYTGIILISYNMMMVPFAVYATFVIEERFGFNKTTPRIFVADRVKALALSVLLGAPLLAGILALFEYAGSYAWLYCWGVISMVVIALQFIAPRWIMPLFNKFTPMEEGELKEAILRYMHSVGYNIDNVFIMDGSKRSSKSNAFFAGVGSSKRIALFDTLIEKHSVPELVAVLAHEIGHYKKRHIQQGIAISIAHTGLLFFVLSVFLHSPGLFQAFYMEQQPIYAGLLFFGLLYTPVDLLLSILFNMISRRNECHADRFAAGTIEEPRSLIDALKRLSATNLSNLAPHPLYVFLNYSHPPLLQRVQAIQRYEVQRAAHV